jgi:hypothetical protein
LTISTCCLTIFTCCLMTVLPRATMTFWEERIFWACSPTSLPSMPWLSARLSILIFTSVISESSSCCWRSSSIVARLSLPLSLNYAKRHCHVYTNNHLRISCWHSQKCSSPYWSERNSLFSRNNTDIDFDNHTVTLTNFRIKKICYGYQHQCR